jgi:NAD(P)-dependent dehydrogenase (short-subunit alcohol dehydrogenase family)
VAIVTGGSRGLGRNMVQSIAGRGTDVIFTYRSNEAEADALVAELEGMGRRAAALQLDVGDAGTFDAFAEQVRDVLGDWGIERFQYLVNNAGIGVYASVADTTEAQFDRLLNIHVKGTFFLTQKLLPLIADGGRTDEVDAICEAAESVDGETPGAALMAWLHRFFAFYTSKRHVASELLQHSDSSNPVFGESRSRVLAAGRPLLVAAQHANEVRNDLTLEQVLDMVGAIATINGDPRYLEAILQTALDGLRPPTDVEPA